ncbi:MAG: hypothetical protein DMG82_03750 [Acidobacteria bacterium]|nr:MAG: hypothetical protein DMG82_03750 [Acidobacteriota bacterium]PYX40831.1 MAG: hypothetical protein DMG83_25680 [Acidobacteriota bacterium]
MYVGGNSLVNARNFAQNRRVCAPAILFVTDSIKDKYQSYWCHYSSALTIYVNANYAAILP